MLFLAIIKTTQNLYSAYKKNKWGTHKPADLELAIYQKTDVNAHLCQNVTSSKSYIIKSIITLLNIDSMWAPLLIGPFWSTLPLNVSCYSLFEEHIRGKIKSVTAFTYTLIEICKMDVILTWALIFFLSCSRFFTVLMAASEILEW